jgi:hypothetical protein
MSRRDSEHTQLIPVPGASPLADPGTAVLPPLVDGSMTARLDPATVAALIPRSPALPFIRTPAQTLTNEAQPAERRSALPFVEPLEIPEDARDTLPPTGVSHEADETDLADQVEDDEDEDDELDTMRPARLASGAPWATLAATEGHGTDTHPPPPATPVLWPPAHALRAGASSSQTPHSPPTTLPPGPVNPFADGVTAHLPLVPLAPALPFSGSTEGSNRPAASSRSLADLRAELEQHVARPAPRGRFDTILPPSEDLGGLPPAYVGYGAPPALAPIPTEVLEVPQGALDLPPPGGQPATAPPPAFVSAAAPLEAPGGGASSLRSAQTGAHSARSFTVPLPLPATRPSVSYDATPARPLVAPLAPAKVVEPTERAEPVLRIEGLTLEEFSSLRAALGSEPQRRRELLRARGLGEVRWRLCERRWAAHFRAMEVSPGALLEGLRAARRARAVIIQKEAATAAAPEPRAGG